MFPVRPLFKVFPLLMCCVVFAQPLSASPITVELSGAETNSSGSLKVSGFSGGKAEVFPLSDPPRLVVDLIGGRSNREPTLSVQELPFIEGVRMGIHSDKVRVVLDLKKNSFPEYAMNYSEDGVSIVFGSSTLKTPPSPPRPTAVDVISVERVRPFSPVEIKEPSVNLGTVAAENTVTGSTRASLELGHQKTRVSGVPSLQGQGVQQVKGFEFIPGEEDKPSELKIEMSSRPIFSLNQSDAELFRISIPESILSGTHLKHPFFPPHRFIGLKMVQATQHENGVELTLRIERGTSVRAFSRGNDLVVEVTPLRLES